MKKRHTSNNNYKNNPDLTNQVDEYDDQFRSEMEILLIELKAFASQLSPQQQLKSIIQNKLRLKEVNFLTTKKKAA